MGEENELSHHGILNQRWGVKNGPPYPLSRSQMSSAEKKAQKKSKVSDILEKRRQKKEEDAAARRRAEALRKAREAKAAKRDLEKEKERIMREGTAEELRSIKSELTSKEIEQVLKRLDLDRRIDEAIAKDRDRGWNAINHAMKKVGDVNNWISTGLNSYDNTVKVKNILDRSSDSEKKSGKKK